MKRYAALVCATVAIVLITRAATGQSATIIDTTTQVRKEWKNPKVTVGGGGGIGRKLPLQIAIEASGAPFNGNNGTTILDFILTNSGKEEITLPVSTNAADLESSESFRHAAFIVKSVSSGEVDGKVLQCGDDPKNPYLILYGTQNAQGTMKTLAPGESLRIRAEVALPNVHGAEASDSALVARLMVDDSKITTRNGQLFLENEEIGSTSSPQYTLRKILKLPD